MAAEFNYEEMCAALLCLFFSAILNDSICLNFRIYSNYVKHVGSKSFNECVNEISKKYDKKRLLINHGIVHHMNISLYYVHSISDYA